MATTTRKTLTVRLGHRSSISGARWCQPIGWEPANTIQGAEFIDGSWWGEEEAGIVCFVAGDEDDEIEVELDDLRLASCGDCRVIGTVDIEA